MTLSESISRRYCLSFYTAEGDEHCVVTITPEEYNAFNQ